jgi:hypothetical protein
MENGETTKMTTTTVSGRAFRLIEDYVFEIIQVSCPPLSLHLAEKRTG